MFSIQARVGLSTFLLRGGDLSEHVIADIHDGLDLMPSGPLPPNPSELLASQRLVDGLARMAEGYDVVLFDAPPALANTDSVILASLVDGTLCVVDLARTRRREVQRTLELLDRAGARVIGTCVNRYGRAARGESYY
jgi:capsular exopolysaccharide synthesis family protein